MSSHAPYAHPLLPTPPSSPPSTGMHPVESTISLLESLVAFYHQERMWVYRTRAQLETDLFDRSPDASPASDAALGDRAVSPPEARSAESAEDSSPSPPTKWLKRKKAFNLRLEGISSARSTGARRGVSKHPYPHTQHRARQSSNLNPASLPASSRQHGPTLAGLQPYATSNTTAAFYPPTAIDPVATLTSPHLSHPALQFQSTANQQQLGSAVATPRYVPPSTHQTAPPIQPQPLHTGPLVLGAGGREPSVQILEMFERMMQARMESCERVTRMVRDANKPGGAGPGPAGVVGGVHLGSVGGPVGGFGGPIGLPVGIGPQEIVGGYAPAAAGGQTTATDQGFPMGVSLA